MANHDLRDHGRFGKGVTPLETRYNGYRFRSRLEARWAVFFDRLSIRYQYEPEGFRLPGIGGYLPDFFLPDQNTFVEIKPLIEPLNPLRIYLAGKIDHHDWRHSLVIGLRDSVIDASDFATVLSLPMRDGGNLVYCGPFFVACDHGCSHGAQKHGCGDGCNDVGQTREIVVKKCLSGVRGCDICFAFVESADCYGTLIEIGYALASGKLVYVTFSEEMSQWLSRDASDGHSDDYDYGRLGRHDFWFAEAVSHNGEAKNNTYKTGRDAFVATMRDHGHIGDIDDDAAKIMELCKSVGSADGMLIRGEPWKDSHQVFSTYHNSDGWSVGLSGGKLALTSAGWRFPNTDSELQAAMWAARSERFGT